MTLGLSQLPVYFGYSYYEILYEADLYSSIAEIYKQSVDILSTSLILMTIGAVIIGFVVNIKSKYIIWTSLIIGILVSAISFLLFGLGGVYLFQAEIASFLW